MAVSLLASFVAPTVGLSFCSALELFSLQPAMKPKAKESTKMPDNIQVFIIILQLISVRRLVVDPLPVLQQMQSRIRKIGFSQFLPPHQQYRRNQVMPQLMRSLETLSSRTAYLPPFLIHSVNLNREG